MGKRGLHWSRNASACVANGIVDSPARSMNYIIQKPGDSRFKTYSLEKLRVAVASGEVQLDWQARNNGKEITVREALSTCYECGKEISSVDVACPSCGAPLRATQPSSGPIGRSESTADTQPKLQPALRSLSATISSSSRRHANKIVRARK